MPNLVLMLLRASCLFQLDNREGLLDDVLCLNAPSSFLSIPTQSFRQLRCDQQRLNAPSSFLSIPTPPVPLL